jgi:hypothetical protein
MCDLLTDIQIEAGTFTGNTNDATPITCVTGRVIIAASAHTGSVGSNNAAVPVALSDGALTDICQVATTAAVTVSYYLTTAKASSL